MIVKQFNCPYTLRGLKVPDVRSLEKLLSPRAAEHTL